MKRSSRLVVGASLAALLAPSAVACGDTDTEADGKSTTIGVVLDQTGVLASLAKPALNAVRLAVDEVNKSGGVDGQQIKLIVEDAGSDPTVAAAAARSISPKVQVVIGAATGTSCRAMQPILASFKILHYCMSGQEFDVAPQFFWGSAPVREYGPAIADWLHHKGLQTIALIRQNDSTGESLAALMPDIVAGGQPGEFRLVAEQSFASGATNLEAQMTRIRAANPDMIVVGTSGTNVVPVIQAMNALGMSQPVFVAPGSWTLDALGPVTKHIPAGGLYSTAWWVDVVDQLPDTVKFAKTVREFAAAYSAEYGQPANASAAGAYDATMQIVAALKGGATTGVQIASYLETHPYTGVMGPYIFSTERHQGATLPHLMSTYDSSGTFRLAYSEQP